jgi:hypothetical protein
MESQSDTMNDFDILGNHTFEKRLELAIQFINNLVEQTEELIKPNEKEEIEIEILEKEEIE